MCGMMHGLATLDTAAVEAAAGDLSTTRFARGILAETALGARDWGTLAATLDSILRDQPSDLRAWELRAEFAAALGRWEEALQAADKAIGLGTERAETLHLSAAIHLENGEHPLTLVPKFRELVAHPHLSGHTNREVALVQAAWVHVRAGNLEEAREVIDAALEANTSVSARVILADILYKDGDHAASEGVLQDRPWRPRRSPRRHGSTSGRAGFTSTWVSFVSRRLSSMRQNESIHGRRESVRSLLGHH